MPALVIANWKMNGSVAAVLAFGQRWQELSREALDDVVAVICPPSVYAAQTLAAVPGVEVGAQDCSAREAGAYTGEVAADMWRDLGCSTVIVGHSERRQYHGESDALVAEKAVRAQAAGLRTVVCVGESLAQRESGEHAEVVSAQLAASLEAVSADGLVIAYEPVWAIGTGVTASPEQANAMHGIIRAGLQAKFGEQAATIPVIYGGSVKPDNASELFACDMIDGALVGGASLEAESFWAIAQAASSGRT